MLYSDLIAKLRVELKDFEVLHRETFDGDNSTKNFLLSHIPIKDGSYTIKDGGSEKTENADYILNKDNGVLTFTTAPATGPERVEVSYSSVKIRDEDYLTIFNDAIDHFRWKFWKENTDTSTLTTTKDEYEKDISGLSDILYPLGFWYKSSSGSTVWIAVQGLTNWEWYPRQTKIIISPPFDTTGLSLKVRYLKSFSKGTAVSDTVDVPDEWILPYKFYCYARYYERLIPEKIHETAAVTTQPSFAPAQVIFNIAEMYYRKADEVANKIAPKLPPLAIKVQHQGVVL